MLIAVIMLLSLHLYLNIYAIAYRIGHNSTLLFQKSQFKELTIFGNYILVVFGNLMYSSKTYLIPGITGFVLFILSIAALYHNIEYSGKTIKKAKKRGVDISNPELLKQWLDDNYNTKKHSLYITILFYISFTCSLIHLLMLLYINK